MKAILPLLLAAASIGFAGCANTEEANPTSEVVTPAAYEEAKCAVGKAQTEAKELEAKVADLSDKLAATGDERSAAAAAVTKANEELTETKGELAESRTRVKELEAKVDDLSGKLEAAGTERKNAVDTSKTATEELAEANNELTKTKESVKDLEAKVDALEGQLDVQKKNEEGARELLIDENKLLVTRATQAEVEIKRLKEEDRVGYRKLDESGKALSAYEMYLQVRTKYENRVINRAEYRAAVASITAGAKPE
jgi:outer membrane murein-binding lipoprotein Lpp